MGQHYLTPLFAPKSIAVVGASEKPGSVGNIVYRNILEGGFKGPVHAVNPKHDRILDRPSYPSVGAIGEAVELAVIITPAATVPDVIEDCGKHNVRSAVVLSAGFGEGGPRGIQLEHTLVSQARSYGVRLIGPNCLGVMRPSIGLNATFSHGGAKPGKLALVSQSGALCTAILDWAQPNDVGFSSVISMGASADIDFGEILDFLVYDAQTDSILLYIEGIRHARSFMSALRAAARIKPVIAIKVGRHEAGSRAALSHTGSLVGSDDVFDAALRRAGVVRVSSVVQLFAAAKALSSGFRPRGDRLAIVTNGGGPGVMATDRAVDLGMRIAELSPATIETLNQALPPTWSHANPVDIIGDADKSRYRAAVSACLKDPNVDGVLTILTPQAMTAPLEAAQAVIECARESNKPMIACWMGETQVATSRVALSAANIPNFRSPEPAVEVFSYLSAYFHNQQLLLQTPASLSHHLVPDAEGARMLVEGALSERRKVLSEMESKALLAAFHIPVAKTVVAHSANEALLLAEEFGFPVAMKVDSPDITHKSDAGGVRLNIGNAQAVRSAYHEIIAEVTKNRPNARIHGVAIEPMVVKPNGRELMVGVTTDAVFGPVITFGAGGTTVEVLSDRSVSLPPLNRYLAETLINSTRAARMLGEFRHMPPADIEALIGVLLRVSEMVCELPCLREMDINPLIVDESGVLAVDARIILDDRPPPNDRYAHMSIHPYPTHLESHWQLPDGTDILIRPIRPEDAEIEQAFVRNLSSESKYFRFMDSLQELSQTMLVRFTQIDYDREMALIAVTGEEGKETELAVARYVITPDNTSCEFALVVADEWQKRGFGRKLMIHLMEAARAKGLRTMEGEVLASNRPMLRLVQSLGFEITTSEEDASVKKVRKAL